jgi:hypothetical protein
VSVWTSDNTQVERSVDVHIIDEPPLTDQES